MLDITASPSRKQRLNSDVRRCFLFDAPLPLLTLFLNHANTVSLFLWIFLRRAKPSLRTFSARAHSSTKMSNRGMTASVRKSLSRMHRWRCRSFCIVCNCAPSGVTFWVLSLYRSLLPNEACSDASDFSPVGSADHQEEVATLSEALALMTFLRRSPTCWTREGFVVYWMSPYRWNQSSLS